MSSERKALVVLIDSARRHETHAAFADARLPALAGAARATMIAPSCWTLPCVTSTLTGLFPTEHGMTWGRLGGPCEAPTVADLLRAAGRSFRLLTGNHVYAPPVIDLPEQCLSISRMKRVPQATFLARALGLADYGGRRIVSEVRRMAESGDLPDLLLVHLQEAHHPYLPPPSGIDPAVRGRYAIGHLAYYLRTSAQAWEFAATADEGAWEIQRERYRECLRYAVRCAEEILRAYDRADALHETLVVITADHGEHLGEHGLADHQGSLNEELIDCPCALIAPGVEPESVVPGQFQHTDLLYTICRYLEVPVAGYAPAAPPRDMLDGAGRDYAFSEWTSWGRENLATLARRNPSYDFAPLDRDLMAVRTDRWKYIVGGDGSEMLFDLQQEPGETRDRRHDRRTIADELRGRLHDWRSTVGARASALTAAGPGRDDEGIGARRLRDLGYI